MILPTIKELVSDDYGGGVIFDRFEDNKLWYYVYWGADWNGRLRFDFPVPVEDTAGAIFYAKDEKRIYFMRWMRKHLEFLRDARAEAASAAASTPAETEDA